MILSLSFAAVPDMPLLGMEYCNGVCRADKLPACELEDAGRLKQLDPHPFPSRFSPPPTLPPPTIDEIAVASTDWKLGSDAIAFVKVSVKKDC